MRKVWIAVTIAAVMWGTGCDLFRSAPDDAPVEERELTPEQLMATQVGAIEELRGRELPDSIQIERGDPAEEVDEAVGESVQREWDWFEQILFGGKEFDLALDDPGWAQAAQYDEATGRLLFDAEYGDVDDRLFAMSMAANRALEKELLGPLPEAQTVDEWLAREIVRRAGPAFVSTMVQGKRLDVGLTLDDLGERPELAIHVPGVGEGLEAIAQEGAPGQALQPMEESEFFGTALQQLVLRKALSLGATLYRSGEWAGVEWGRSEPPMRSDYVVHPRRWFDGDGPAQWEWPESFEGQRREGGWEEVRSGMVGPAMTSLWLQGLVGARAARTIYGGWRADTYRIYQRGEGEGAETAFHWVSAWETPHDAQEIGSAAEAVLGHYLGHEHSEKRFRVAVQGLNVAVSIYDKNQSTERLNSEVELLTEARVGYLPADGAPFAFVPTLYDRYVEHTEGATLDLEDEIWIDPASGWQVELGALEGWTVQRSNEAHVRWFASHSDGTMIQWTTELVDPLDAEFGSEVYLDRLGETFAQSVSAREEPTVEMIDSPVDSTIEMEVMGLIEGRPLILHLWQWRRGDVLVSFSIQGPEAFFGDRMPQAEAILATLEEHGEAIERRESAQPVEPGEDSGIIEFRIEDE